MLRRPSPGDWWTPLSDRVRDWAESGVMHLTGSADGPPGLPPGGAATAARTLEERFGGLTGQGSRIGWHHLLAERAALSGAHSRRAPWSVGGFARAVRTLDGWVAATLVRPDDVAAIGALTKTSVPVDAPAAWSALDRWAASRSSAEVSLAAAELGIPLGAIPAAGEWASSGGPRTVEVAEGAPLGEPFVVVDFSALWAGPMCAQLLGTAGARVVKVEFAGRLDGARSGLASLYDVLHGGHESVLIDPVADTPLLQALVRRADVVIEASRPRSLLQLGIDALDVCRESPTTWVSITAWGREFEDQVGFGDDVAMSAGLVVRRDGVPFPVGDAFADPLSGMHAAVATLESVRRGGSRLLDIGMRDVVATHSAALPGPDADAERAGFGWEIQGHRVLEPAVVRSPEGPAPAAGEHTETWRHLLR